jgi:hypothetical protein
VHYTCTSSSACTARGERRRRRRAGDLRLTEADREHLGRLADGDLADELQEVLDTISAADPLLGDSVGDGAGAGDDGPGELTVIVVDAYLAVRLLRVRRPAQVAMKGRVTLRTDRTFTPQRSGSD